MSQAVTLDLPDAVYQKFKARSQQTQRSLEEELLTAFALDLPILPVAETIKLQAYNEVIDFLLSAPLPAEIVQFQLSEQARQRAQMLLRKQRAEGLSANEEKELDFYVDLGDFLGILRAKAQLQLQGSASL